MSCGWLGAGAGAEVLLVPTANHREQPRQSLIQPHREPSSEIRRRGDEGDHAGSEEEQPRRPLEPSRNAGPAGDIGPRLDTHGPMRPKRKKIATILAL